MFENSAQIVAALRRARDTYDPRTSSLLSVPRGAAATEDPFHPGFLAAIDERDELERRLAMLPETQRTLLLMWFTVGKPVAHIARQLRISRVHCYRLKARAFETMLGDADGAETAAEHA